MELFLPKYQLLFLVIFLGFFGEGPIKMMHWPPTQKKTAHGSQGV